MQRTQRKIPSQPKRFEHFLPHWFFLGIVFLVLIVSFAGPEWLPPSRVPDRLVTYPFGPGVAQANDCPPPNPCGYWDGYRWHCACGGGGDKPPSINGNVSCGKAGQNGWCVSNAQLSLTASDPQGYAVTISGDLNGTPFTCGSSCTLSLPKGTGTANYTVTASTSNLTASGNTTWKYDPDPPVPNLNVSGTSGSNSWYISPVSIAAAGTDAISGIAGASISVDGGVEQSSATLDDGIHQIVASAIDNAGNTTSTTFTIKVDSTTPQIDVSAAGAPGSNGWYVSNVQVSANASDPSTGSGQASGVASLEETVDGGAWTAYTSPITLSDGIHSVQFRAADNAGNVTTTAAQTYSVDTTAPVITPAVTGTNGNNSWYKSNAKVSASATDAASGLDTFEVTVDGGAWTAYTVPTTLSDGNHSVQFRATDKAGNASQITQSVAVDTQGPMVHLPSKWTLGQNVKFTITDSVSGLAAARVVIEDQAEKYKKVHWDESVSGASFSGGINWDGRFADGAIAPPGDYEVWVKTSDNAGNETFQLGWVTVPEPSVFSWILPPLPTWTAAPTTAPSPTPTPTIQPTATVRPALNTVEASVPSKPAVIVVSSSSAGGIRNNQPAPDPIQSNLPLVSAAVAAMAAAAAYEAKRKQEAEQAAHLAIAQRNAKRNGKKDTAPMSYRQIAKAYQASLNSFKAKLMGQGLSDAEASAFQKQAIQNGSVSSVMDTAQNAVEEKQRQIATGEAKRREMEAQRAEKKEALLASPAQPIPQEDGYDTVEALRANRTDESSQASTDKPWWLSTGSENAAHALVQAIPSAKVGSWRSPVPAFSLVSPEHVISFGKVTSGMLASDAHPGLMLNPDGSFTPSVGQQPIASLTPRPDGFDFNLRNPWQKYDFTDGAIKATLSSSVTSRVTWGGFWNTKVGMDVNYPEVQVNGAGVKGRVSSGWYLEYKPGRVLTYAVAAPIIIGGAILIGSYILQTGDTSVLKPIFQH